MLAIVALLGATSAPHRSLAAVEPDWFPLHPGAQWSYDVHRDLTLRPDKAALNRIFYVGRASWVAEPAPDRAPGGFLVREETVQKQVEGGGKQVALAHWTLYSFASELRIHASGETNEDGTQSEILYKPPLRMLPTTTVGESWNAGTFRQGDQRAELRGKVIGIENLEGEPRWSGCLKVQFEGSISGSVTVDEVRAEIESAHYDRVVWFARDVGIVRDVTTMKSEVRLPDGRHANILQESTERLVEHRLSK